MEDPPGKLFTQVRRKQNAYCTDHLWLILFCFVWLIMVVTTYFSISYRNYTAIINGYDTFGNTCGVKGNQPFMDFPLSGTDTSNKPYILFMGYSNFSNVVRICVEHCITEVLLGPPFLYEEHERTNAQLCRYDFNMKILHFSVLKEFNDALGPCPDIPCDESFPVKHRCVPLATSRRKLAEVYAFITHKSDVFIEFFTHVYQAWPYMCALVSFALGLLYLMRCWPRATPRALCLLGLFSTLGVCVVEWIAVLRLPSVESDMSFDFQEQEGRVLYNYLEDFQINKTVIKAVGVFSLLLAEALLFALVFTSADIARVGVLCEEAVKCWKQLPGSIGVSLTTLVAMMVFFTYWTYVSLCTSTASKKKIDYLGDFADYRTDPKIDLRFFYQIKHAEVPWLRDCCWLYIFGFIWTSEFICGCQRFWLEASVTTWYFRRAVDWSLFKEHVGSVARGSFIGLLRIPRLVCVVFCKLLGYYTVAAPLQSGLELFEGQLRMSPGIYAVVVFQNVDLYPAGLKAKAIMASAADHVNDVNNAVHFVFFCAYLLVANSTCLLGILLVHSVDDLFFYMAPVMLSVICAVYIARILLATIEVPLNTLFLCVCEDKHVNKTRGRWSQGQFIDFCIGHRLE